jgi:hypothetical protein
MKKLRIITYFLLVLLSNTVYSQSSCGSNLAKIMSGSYNCEIQINKYGADAAKKNASVKIEKVGENKVQVSAAGCTAFTVEISKGGDASIGGSVTEKDQTRSVSLVLNDKPAKISGSSGNGAYKPGDIYWSFSGESTDNDKPESLRFILQNVGQLDCHLNNLKDDIAGTLYEGTVIRAISKKYIVNGTEGKPLTIFSGVENLWQRYDVQGQKALYFGEALAGNKTEISHYGDWEKAYQVWQWDNITIDNLLDLTDSKNLETLGVTLELLNTGIDSKYDKAPEGDKMYNYEFTNSLSTWARNKKYKGLIVLGARGNKDYRNIVLFEQTTIDAIFAGKEGVILH